MLQAVLAQDERLVEGKGLPGVVEVIKDHRQEQAIMLVGHKDDFNGALPGLTGGGKVHLEKGGLACVEVALFDPPQGKLLLLLSPEVLAKLGAADERR